jgi:SAM-dependent methyltransferase
MKVTERTLSIITGEDRLDHLYTFESFPVYIGCTSEPAEGDILHDMCWMICRDSGMIQLKYLLPPEVVYPAYHSEGIGPTWEAHHQALSDFICRHAAGDILEIGGSNGRLARKYFSGGAEGSVRWTIVEPNPSFQGDERIRVINAFFSEELKIPGIVTVVHSHVLEHLLDPGRLLGHIHRLLGDDGRHIFSIPNLYRYLKNKFSNSINFEHTFFLTGVFADYLLAKSGFEIIEKSFFGEHSIFYATRKSVQTMVPVVPDCYEENKKLFLDMVEYYDAEVARFNSLMDRFDGAVYLFGGHIFSQFLVYRGLNQERIAGIIDNSELKQGRRLYGTGLSISAPGVVAAASPVAVILKAGQYQAEVRDQLLSFNPAVIIWE